MSYVDDLVMRNEEFSKNAFGPGLKMLPSQKTFIIACVDPRIDPVSTMGVKLGEAVIIRNIGGRINPFVLETLKVLRVIATAAGQGPGAGWHFILVQHTNCGIVNCYHQAPQVLAKNLGVETSALDKLSIADPYQAVALDAAAMVKHPDMPVGATVTGFVYDVATGLAKKTVGPLQIGKMSP